MRGVLVVCERIAQCSNALVCYGGAAEIERRHTMAKVTNQIAEFNGKLVVDAVE